MAKNNKLLNEKEKQIKIEASAKINDFFALSKLLFAGDESPYDINELKEDNRFYKPAVSLAEELGIDWKSMTHDESNRIMLSLLDDYYNQIKIDDDHRFLLSVDIEKIVK